MGGNRKWLAWLVIFNFTFLIFNCRGVNPPVTAFDTATHTITGNGTGANSIAVKTNLYDLAGTAAAASGLFTSYRNIFYYGVLGGPNDDTAKFQAAINSGIPTYLDPRTNYTVGNLYLSNNTVLVGNNTVLNFKTNQLGYLFDMQPTNHDIWLEGIVADGGKYYFTGSGLSGAANLYPFDFVPGFIGIAQFASGNRSGFHLCSVATNSTLVLCTARNFSDAGFRFFGNGTFPQPETKTLYVLNCSATTCWAGFSFGNSAEYMAPIGLTTAACGRGLDVQAGNLLFTGGQDVRDGVGVYVQGVVDNPAHSTVASRTINHCFLWAELINFNNGYAFRDCNMEGDGALVITNAGGIVVENCTILAGAGTTFHGVTGFDIVVDGAAYGQAATAGVNYFVNNTLITANPVVARLNGGLLNLSGFKTGVPSTPVVDTNSIFGPLNVAAIASATNGYASYTTHTPVSVGSLGASPFTYLNASAVAQEVYTSGSVAYSVSKNGAAVFGSLAGDGYVVLQPGSTVVVTFTVAPTFFTNSW